MNSSPPDLAQLRRDHENLAKSISDIVLKVAEIQKELAELRTERAVREVEDRIVEKRIKDLETTVASFWSLGKWFLIAAGGALISAVVTFVIRGGLVVPAPTP